MSFIDQSIQQMMKSVFVILQLAFNSQAFASELVPIYSADVKSTMDKFVDELVDKLIDRVPQVWFTNQTQLDATTLGKAGSGAISSAKMQSQILPRSQDTFRLAWMHPPALERWTTIQ